MVRAATVWRSQIHVQQLSERQFELEFTPAWAHTFSPSAVACMLRTCPGLCCQLYLGVRILWVVHLIFDRVYLTDVSVECLKSSGISAIVFPLTGSEMYKFSFEFHPKCEWVCNLNSCWRLQIRSLLPNVRLPAGGCIRTICWLEGAICSF